MWKFQQNVGLVLLISLAAVVLANDPVPLAVDQGKSKIFVSDNSRILTDIEADRLDKEKIPVVVPLLKKDPPKVQPKIGVVVKDEAPKEDVAKTNEENVQLPPIPLIPLQMPMPMPEFLKDIFNQPQLNAENVDSASNTDASKPKRKETPQTQTTTTN